MSKPLSEFRTVDVTTGNPLRDKVYITRGIRLDAARRLRLVGATSLATTTILSCYLTIASVFQLGFSEYISPTGEKLFDATIIGLSLLLLVFSVLEAARKTELSAHQLEENARELAGLHLRIESAAATNKLSVESYDQYGRDYGDTLDKCGVRHTQEDFILYRIRNPHLFPAVSSTAIGRFFLRHWVFAKVYGLYAVTVVSFPVLVVSFVWFFRDVVFLWP